jgi:hypothetical protein
MGSLLLAVDRIGTVELLPTVLDPRMKLEPRNYSQVRDIPSGLATTRVLRDVKAPVRAEDSLLTTGPSTGALPCE